MDESPISADDTWDAGAMGCGELVLALRARLLAMPGRTLKVLAVDPGAPEDLPAFCRMTGHQLLRARGACFWIRARP